MKKHSLTFLFLIMLFTCLSSGAFAQEKTKTKKAVTKTTTKKTETTSKESVVKSTAKKNTSTGSTAKKKTKKKKAKKAVKKKSAAVKKEVVKQDNLRTKICSDSLVVTAKKYLGTHYQYASCAPENGFDCSGFVYYVFEHLGIKVPRSSNDYGSLPGSIPSDSAKIGDVIVFTGTNAANRRAGHVGIILSNPGEPLSFIHSSSNTKHGGVIISNYKSSPYYEKRFIKIVRIANVDFEKCGK